MASVDRDLLLLAHFRSTLPELYAFAARRSGGERSLAEDVVQETWLRAVASWRASGLPREPLAWLKTTARHLLLNHYRTQRRRPSVAVEPATLAELIAAPASEFADSAAHANPTLADDPLTAAFRSASGAAAAVQWGLARLEPEEAQLLEAFHLEGHSTRELAGRHGLSERAIEGRLHRARAKLRRELAALGETA